MSKVLTFTVGGEEKDSRQGCAMRGVCTVLFFTVFSGAAFSSFSLVSLVFYDVS